MNRGYYAIVIDDKVTIHRKGDACEETKVVDYLNKVEELIHANRETGRNDDLPDDLDQETRETNPAASGALIMLSFQELGDSVRSVIESDLLSPRPIHFCPYVWPPKRGR